MRETAHSPSGTLVQEIDRTQRTADRRVLGMPVLPTVRGIPDSPMVPNCPAMQRIDKGDVRKFCITPPGSVQRRWMPRIGVLGTGVGCPSRHE